MKPLANHAIENMTKELAKAWAIKGIPNLQNETLFSKFPACNFCNSKNLDLVD